LKVMVLSSPHERYMSLALQQARVAVSCGEVPVGAVVVRGGQILAVAHNRREQDQDPTGHAELLAIRRAAAEIGHWRLEACHLYVTLEPCAMCAGALVNARLGALIYGARDPKAGAAGSLMNLCQDRRLNHRIEVTAGVLDHECGEVLRDFFRARRRRRE
jgi:tRNA(adenine34) deaminase